MKLRQVKVPKKESLLQKKESELADEDYELIEIDEGLKGKIVEKVNYEKSKHIFPFKNWKIFDPTSDFVKNPILDF